MAAADSTRLAQRQVQVHRFITRGTFEERINDMIRSKRQLAELAVAAGEGWIGQLPSAGLKTLFELDGPWRPPARCGTGPQSPA